MARVKCFAYNRIRLIHVRFDYRFTARFPACAGVEPERGGRIGAPALLAAAGPAGTRSHVAQKRRAHRLGRRIGPRQRKVRSRMEHDKLASATRRPLLILFTVRAGHSPVYWTTGSRVRASPCDGLISTNVRPSLLLAGFTSTRAAISSSGTCSRPTPASTSASPRTWPPAERRPPSH